MRKKTHTEALVELAEQFAPPPESQYFSLGALCGRIGISPGQLHALMAEADVRFDESRDGICYCSGATTQKILDVFNQFVAEIESVRASAPNN